MTYQKVILKLKFHQNLSDNYRYKVVASLGVVSHRFNFNSYVNRTDYGIARIGGFSIPRSVL